MSQPPAASEMRIIEFDGLRLAIDALDSLGLGHGQAFEPEIAAALLRWTQTGDTVVDIGANIGLFTAQLARAVGPTGTVHAFEPEPANHALLAGNMARNGFGQVRLHAAALGAEPGTTQLHTSDFNGGMHRLYDSVVCSGPAVDVPVYRIDDVFAATELHLIKIDVEGYEPWVLQGAERCLRASPRLKIISEYCPPSMLEAGTLPSDMLHRLLGLGYHPHQLDGTAVDITELLADAARYESHGRERFVNACAGRTPPEVNGLIERLTAELGCRRPFIENLLFMRRPAAPPA